MVPKTFTEINDFNEMKHCITVCLELNNQVANEANFIKPIITCQKRMHIDMVQRPNWNCCNERPLLVYLDKKNVIRLSQIFM